MSDPIIKTLLDTDYYKLNMLQYIWKYHRDVNVSWKLTNRTKSVRLAKFVDLDDLQTELNHVASLKFKATEIEYLRSLGTFEEEFLQFLQHGFKLSEFVFGPTQSGQIHLQFVGKWVETTMWEIYALAIINEMRNRKILESVTLFQQKLIQAQALVHLDEKLECLNKQALEFSITDFGTRRRHSAEYQQTVVEVCSIQLDSSFKGTSNVYLSMLLGMTPIGTNAHEIPMVEAALAETDEELLQSQYQVLERWSNLYPNSSLIMLPDTFGTKQFLNGLDQKWVEKFDGIRVDSMDPFEAGDYIEEFYKSRGINPKTKTVIFSDGLDVDDIIDLQDRFGDTFKVAFGWGTNLTNDFRDVFFVDLDPISIVCKVDEVNGRGAVKLSDERSKFLGDVDEIKRYLNVFGANGITESRPQIV